MELLSKNPFNTIKANDLNDDEINSQWVNIPNKSFADLFSPKSKIAKYIVGGKGSGKTHLMRYFSYQAQLIRNKEAPLSGIVDDGYFGIYFQASGLHGSRFDNLPSNNDELKLSAFTFYFELWLTGQLLESIKSILSIDSSLIGNQKEFCTDILALFDEPPTASDSINSVNDLLNTIEDLLKKVDIEINNCHFKDNLDIKVICSRGALIFGIPKLLSKHSPTLKDTTFLYLADELENISKKQQEYFNTLIREKEIPATFRIGVRRHGIKTYKTLGSGEENKEGHEYEVTRLDNEFSDESSYSDFAIELIINRLVSKGMAPIELLNDTDHESLIIKRKNYLQSLFETPVFDSIRYNSESGSPILKPFCSRLYKSKKIHNIHTISNSLSCPDNLIAEKAAIHLFCQEWKKEELSEKQLFETARKIGKELKKFNDDTENSITSKINYYQNNYLASVLRSQNQNNLDSYAGLENLLNLTKGFPRHILTILRHIYKVEVFSGRQPFSPHNRVSIKAQKLALKESSDWFHDDCTTEGELGNQVAIFLDRLCELLRLDFYADKPVECSSSSFALKKSSLSKDQQRILEWATMIRVLIPADRLRQDKNSQQTTNKYHLNGLLCPRWGLPVQRRGALSINESDATALLDTSDNTKYIEYKKRFETERYAPYSFKSENEDKPLQQGLDL